MTILNNTQVVDRVSAINVIPETHSLIGSLGLFREQGVGTKTVTFDVRDRHITVLDDYQRNQDQQNSLDPKDYDQHTLTVAHYPVQSAITVDQLEGLRGFDSENQATLEGEVADHLVRHAESHDQTLEYLRALMLCKGQIETKFAGIVDAYKEFNVKKTVYNFSNLATDEYAEKFREITRLSKKGLKNGKRPTGYVALMGYKMFENILKNPSIKDSYVYNSGAAHNSVMNRLSENNLGYTTFSFGNVTMIAYDDTFTLKDGSQVAVLAEDEGVLFPVSELGRIFFAPSSKLSGLGRKGQKRYAWSKRNASDTAVEIESQQSTLCIATEIGSIVHLTMKAAK